MHRPRILGLPGGGFRHAPGSSLFHGTVKLNPRRRRRHNARRGRRSHRYLMPRMMGNPFRMHRIHRRRRRNPAFALKSLMSKRWLITIGTVSGGVVLGLAGKTLVTNLMPATTTMKYGTWYGAADILIGALMVAFVKNKAIKEMGVIVAGMGLYDLLASNVSALGLPPLPAVDLVNRYVKPKTVGASYNPRLMGASFSPALMGASFTPALNGDFADSPLAEYLQG
jgi:hypothetical protein